MKPVKARHGKLVYRLDAKVDGEVCQRLQHPGIDVALVDAPLHRCCKILVLPVTVQL